MTALIATDHSDMPLWDIPWTLLAIAASIIFICALPFGLGLARSAGKPAPPDAPSAQDTPAPAPTGAQPDDEPVFGSKPLDLCMVIGCPELWSVDRLGWRTCVHHTKPMCKACQRNPATQVEHTLCLPCHEQISRNFDTYVDRALTIANIAPTQDEVLDAAADDFASEYPLIEAFANGEVPS